jgi:hypothetical protein
MYRLYFELVNDFFSVGDIKNWSLFYEVGKGKVGF